MSAKDTASLQDARPYNAAITRKQFLDQSIEMTGLRRRAENYNSYMGESVFRRW